MDLLLHVAVFLPAIALVSSLPRDLAAIAKAIREANEPIEEANNMVEKANMEEKLDRGLAAIAKAIIMEANELDEEANDLDEEANELDAEANELDEEANELDEEANEIGEIANNIDEIENEMDDDDKLFRHLERDEEQPSETINMRILFRSQHFDTNCLIAIFLIYLLFLLVDHLLITVLHGTR